MNLRSDISRRRFMGTASAGIATAPLFTTACAAKGGDPAPVQALPPSIQALQSVRPQVQPIAPGEYQGRLARAQQLMSDNRIDAIFMRGGTSLAYFTGMIFGGSERTLGMVLPQRGDPIYVTPAFEEGRARADALWSRSPSLAGRPEPIPVDSRRTC